MTEAELARDVHAVLEKVRQDAEVVIEQGDRAVAVLRVEHSQGSLERHLVQAIQDHVVVTEDVCEVRRV